MTAHLVTSGAVKPNTRPKQNTMSDDTLKPAEELHSRYTITISQRQARALEALLTLMSPEAKDHLNKANPESMVNGLLHMTNRVSSGRDPSDRRGRLGMNRAPEKVERLDLITHLFNYGLATTLLKLSERDHPSLYGIESEAHKLELRATIATNSALVMQSPMPSAEVLRDIHESTAPWRELEKLSRAEIDALINQHPDLIQKLRELRPWNEPDPTETATPVEHRRSLDQSEH